MESISVSVRQREKLETNRRLLDSAQQLFGTNGISESRTADIATLAGVAHGTLFLHFPQKDDLIVAVISRYGERVTRALHDLVEAGASLKGVLEAHLRTLADDEVFYMRLVLEGPSIPVRARNAFLGIQSAIAWHLAAALRREMASGRVKEMRLDLLFNTWVGVVHHYVVNRDLFAPGAEVLIERMDELVNHFLNLIS